MDIRQYDIYIDGIRLPRWFLPDSDTQLGVRSDFEFWDVSVERFGTETNVFGELVSSTDQFTPGIAGFAGLDRVLCFRLRRSVHGLQMRLGSTGEHMRLKAYGAGNVIVEFGHDTWWGLEWGRRYVLSAEDDGRRSQMTVEVRRLRVPFGASERSLLNRRESPRAQTGDAGSRRSSSRLASSEST
jgi:hypothetical protein